MVSDLRSLILTVADEYTLDKSQRFGGNELASLIHKTGPEILHSVAARTDLFSICSVGQGNWAEIPWFGVFNSEVSVSETRGIYVVYLFSADMGSVYLCQDQGVTAVKQNFGKSQYQELYRRSALIRDRVPEHKKSFGANTIKLNGKTKLAQEYEPAVSY
jgi:5-methylcytosine-specific restriction enzyme A